MRIQTLRRLIEGFRGWAGALLVLLPGSLIVTLLPGLERRRRAARRVARAGMAAIGIRLVERRRAPLPEGPSVVVSNHASYLDGILLTAVLPPRFSFVIKREASAFPGVARLLHRLGSTFVERTDPSLSRDAAQTVIQRARTGEALGFFAEGTFAAEPGLLPFRKGAFHAAQRAGIPVVPVTIRGSRGVLPARRWWPSSGTVEVIVGEAIRPEPGRDGLRRLMSATRAIILENLEEPDLQESGDRAVAARRSAG